MAEDENQKRDDLDSSNIGKIAEDTEQISNHTNCLLTKLDMEKITARFEYLHELNATRDLALLEEVKKISSKTIDHIDDAAIASNIRTRITQRSTIWNTQYLKLVLGAIILLGLLVLIIVYNDAREIADVLKTFLLPLLTAILGFAIWLLGIEAPKKIEKSSNELPTVDTRPNTESDQ